MNKKTLRKEKIQLFMNSPTLNIQVVNMLRLDYLECSTLMKDKANFCMSNTDLRWIFCFG